MTANAQEPLSGTANDASTTNWDLIHPTVSAEAEFFEILNDFTSNPSLIIRKYKGKEKIMN